MYINCHAPEDKQSMSKWELYISLNGYQSLFIIIVIITTTTTTKTKANANIGKSVTNLWLTLYF